MGLKVCYGIVLMAAMSAAASAQTPPGTAALKVWVFTKPDPTGMQDDLWRLRDNARIYIGRLLTPQTGVGGYKEEARRAFPMELATTEDDGQISLEVINVERGGPPPAAPGEIATTDHPKPFVLTVRVTGDGLTPTELKGQGSITHGAVLDFLKQFDKWLKENEAALQRLKGGKMNSGGAGPS
jgi:hypothetical protein